jgi:adenylosuccinate synthase
MKPREMRYAVIGLGFGDEGKGMVTSALAAYFNNPLIIRYSGGHQAGHTVDFKGVKHTFANFGSGTLQGCPTYWSRYCTVEPVGLLTELSILVDKLDKNFDGVRIYIHNECPVTTPYDIYHNQKMEVEQMYGTCGVGFGDTLEREEDHFHLQFSDLFNPTVLKIKLEQIRKYYGLFNILKDVDMKPFMNAVDVLNDHKLFPSDVIVRVNSNEIPSHPNNIYEGSQGLLLDQDIGFFPNVTRSNVGRKRLDDFIYHYDEVYYVTRAYQTRHGYGPMTNEQYNLELINTEGEANVENKYQGEFRKTILDLDLLNYALEHDQRRVRNVQTKNLVITCLDQMVDWRFTQSGNVFQMKTEEEFVQNVISGLNFDGKVYLSRSAKSELIEWEGGKSHDA